MAAIVNLNKFRKQQARATAAERAAENRARHGRSQAERNRTASERQRAAKALDDRKIDGNDSDG